MSVPSPTRALGLSWKDYTKIIVGIALLCVIRFTDLILSKGLEPSSIASTTNVRMYAAMNSTLVKETMESYNICRVIGDFKVGYTCSGPNYTEFAQRFEYMVMDTSRNKPSSWGRRTAPFPPQSTIVIVGNSHTRQVADALICQYTSKNLSSVPEKVCPMANSTNNQEKYGYCKFTYQNQATLHMLTNHAIVYSKQWIKYLDKVIGVPMSEVDAFIVGKFNGYQEAENTTFYNDMLELVVNYEDASLSNPPPTLFDFAQAYPGPIVGHSMFADWGNNYLHMDMVHDMEKIRRRNVRLIEGRHYVPQLGECGAKTAGVIGTCDEDKSAHRCTGARGGHPDLIAWDIIEAVNELLE